MNEWMCWSVSQSDCEVKVTQNESGLIEWIDVTVAREAQCRVELER